MEQVTRRFARHAATFIVVALTTLLFGVGTASAQDAGGLAKYLSSQNDVVMGLNLTELRSNKYYDRLVEWARGQSGGGELLKAFEAESGLDIEKDIDAVAIAFPSTGSMQKQQQKREFAMAISGKFESDKLVSAIKKQGTDLQTKEVAGLKFYKSSDVWLAVPKDGLALMTAGDDGYVKKNISTFGNQKGSIRKNKRVKEMLGEVDVGGDIWIAGDMTSVPASSDGPRPNSLGMEIDFAKGLALEMVAQMDSKEDATTSVEQMEAMQSQGANNPIVTMLGAKPLVDNLAIKSSGPQVRFSTEMTSKEFDTMISAIMQMAKSRGMGGMPSGGATPKSGATPKKGGSGSSNSSGADADFN
ncbi:MAG: hypothetical protein ACQEVA_15395 [Myxococcota bacterium]